MDEFTVCFDAQAEDQTIKDNQVIKMTTQNLESFGHSSSPQTPHITLSISQHSPGFKVPSLVQTLNQEKATNVLHHIISITRSILSESLPQESSK